MNWDHWIHSQKWIPPWSSFSLIIKECQGKLGSMENKEYSPFKKGCSLLPRVSSYLTLCLKIVTGTKRWAETRGLDKKGSPGWDQPGRRGSPEGGGLGTGQQEPKTVHPRVLGWTPIPGVLPVHLMGAPCWNKACVVSFFFFSLCG